MCLYALPLLSLAARSHSAIDSTARPAVHLDRRPATYTVCVRPQRPQATFFLALDNDLLHRVRSRSSWVGSFEAVAAALLVLPDVAVIHVYLVLKGPIHLILWVGNAEM